MAAATISSITLLCSIVTLIRYAADLKDYQNNNLHFEIDSRTGELLSVFEQSGVRRE